MTVQILLMGKQGVGKTSMTSIIFAEKNARDCWRLPSTGTTAKQTVRLLNDTVELEIWECGGRGDQWTDEDPGNPEKRERMNEKVFGGVSCLVYILDANSPSPEDDLQSLESNVSLLRHHSSDASFHVLLHKSDIFYHGSETGSHLSLSSHGHGHGHGSELRAREGEIRRRALPTLTECHITTIWDESLFRAWSSIISPLLLHSVPNFGLLTGELGRLMERSKADEVLFYEARTLLLLTHVGRRAATMDGRRFERISNVLRRIRACARRFGALPCSIAVGWDEGALVAKQMRQDAAIVILVSVKEDWMEEMEAELESFRSILDAVLDSHPEVDPHML